MKSSEFEGCQDHACSIQSRCSHAKIKAYINALKEERTLSQKRERYDFLPREMPDDRIGPGIPERMKQLSEKPLDLDCEITRQYIATLQSQLAASQKREQILLDGMMQYADRRNWTSANARSRMKDSWAPGIFGYDIAEATIKAAAEVNV